MTCTNYTLQMEYTQVNETTKIIDGLIVCTLGLAVSIVVYTLIIGFL